MKRSTLLETIDVGKTIKKLREERGLSQEELAKDICDRTNITKLENGHSKIPSLSFILLICDRLEVTIQDFLNLATDNHYALNRKLILDLLMNKKYHRLAEYINIIDSNLLFSKDKFYYLYLESIIDFHNNDLIGALNNLTYIQKNHLDDDFITRLTTGTLNLLRGNDDELKCNDDEEMLYLLELYFNHYYDKKEMDKANHYLEREQEFINSHFLNKYLQIYHKNKFKLAKSDFENENELKDKRVKNSEINK